jgi:hypothetical protein
METAKVSRFLPCIQSTSSQVSGDISGILDRSVKACTKEIPFRDRIRSFVHVGNQRKGLLGRHSVVLAEIRSFFSFIQGSWLQSCRQPPCSIYLHQCIVDQKVILLTFGDPGKRV